MARKKKTHPAQMALLELAIKTAPCVPAIRQEVRDWVADGYKGATPTTETLLNYWFHTEPPGQWRQIPVFLFPARGH